MPAAMEPEEEIWKESVPCIVGIDEAGRGPVLGPMVYTAAYCPKVSVKPLKALGADDSKQLSEEQRNSLRKKIDGAPFLRYKTRILSAQELSENMLRKEKYNLNLISHDTAFELVQQILDDGINVTEIYVDTVGRPESYSAKFHDQFPQVGKIVVAKKADATYRIVGAASIVAKTTRDRNLREWHFPEEERSAGYAEGQANASVSFQDARGSGYPGDPLTKAWMEKNCDPVFGFPTLVRFSWGTTRLLMEKEAVKVDWDVSDDEEEEQEKQGKPKNVKTKDIKSFFSANAKSSSGRPTKQRKLTKSSCPIPHVLKSMSLQRSLSLM